MKRLGYHIAPPGFDRSRVRDWARRSGSNSHLVLMDNGFAQQLADDGTPVVVSRSNHPDDAIHIPEWLIDDWGRKAREAPSVYQYWPNEPIPSTHEHRKIILDNCIRLMYLSADAKVKACIGNFAIGAMHRYEDVASGMWDNFIRAASEYTNSGQGYIGMHDYTTGALSLGCAGGDPFDMINPESPSLQRDNWPTIGDIRAAGNNWLVMRWIDLEHRANLIGVAMFKILITEGLWDRMPNLEGMVRSGVKLFDVLTHMAKHRHIRGPLTQRFLWEAIWPQWGMELAMRHQLRWAEETYPDYVHGIHIFALNKSNRPGAEWDEQFNYEHWPEMLEAIMDMPGAPAAQDVHTGPRPGPIRSAGNWRVNLRSYPRTDSSVITHLFDEWQNCILYSAPVIGPHEFVPIKLGDFPPLWVSRKYVDFRPHC